MQKRKNPRMSAVCQNRGENRAMLICNERSCQAHCVGGCRSVSVAGSDRGRDLNVAAADHCSATNRPQEAILRCHRPSRPRGGRPPVPLEIRRLIHEMSIANPLWGAPRIHGELLKLDIAIGQTSVAKYMAKRRGPPSQGWKTFLRNHADGIAAIDLFVVPTMAKRVCRTADRFDPTGMPRPRCRVRRVPPPSPAAVVHEIL